MTTPEKDRDDRIADYLRGVLDEDAVRQLEIDMLEDQELFERVETEALLRQGLLTTETKSLSMQQPARASWTWWSWGGYALAGGLALMVVGLGLRLHDIDRQLDVLSSPAAGIQVITLQEQRALGQGAVMQLSELSESDGLLIEIDVSARGDSTFSVDIETASQRHHWHGLRADSRGYLTIYVPPGEVPVRLSVSDELGRIIAEHH